MSLRIRQSDSKDNSHDDNLDVLVNETIHCVRLTEDSPLGHWGVLLSTIVKYSNKRLDRQYRDLDTATSLLRRNSNLLDMLKEAWHEKSYRKIVNLEVLQSPNLSEPGRGRDISSWSLYRSFYQPYRGIAVDGLYEYLEANNKAFTDPLLPSYYAKFCSIVQSSGTGKSRLMIELRQKDVIVLYMNLRPQDDNSFPPCDPIPASILTKNIGFSRAEYHSRCCAFFSAIFMILRDELLDLFNTSGDVTQVASLWNEGLCTISSDARYKFFGRLESKYNEVYSDIIGKTPSSNETAVTDAYMRMVESLPQLFTADHRPKVVVAIDDAHTLNRMDGFQPSTILCSVISTYSRFKSPWNHSTWVVFASTTLKIADFAARHDRYESSRISESGERLFEPYTRLGWDQNALPLESLSPRETANFQRVLCFGRPSWSSLVAHSDVTQLVNLAVQKLCGHQTFCPHDVNHMLAILGQRFCLEVRIGHPWTFEHVERGVTSRLRVCFSSADRTWTFTGYPSEPFLSCISAFVLHRAPSLLQECLNTLRKNIYHRMVSTGVPGALASRMLWLLSKDLFVRTRLPNYRGLFIKAPGVNQRDTKLIDCQMIPLIAYLGFVFGKEHWKAEVKEAFANAYINFSHWTEMETTIAEEDQPQVNGDEWTLRHWHRTSAVQCCRHQPLVDKMIPIYFADSGQVSQIFISDRAGQTSSLAGLASINRDDEYINCTSDVPYIAILVDWRLERSEFEDMWCPTGDDGPSLRIYAAGVNASTFPFLRDHHLVEEFHHLVFPEKVASYQATTEIGDGCRMCAMATGMNNKADD